MALTIGGNPPQGGPQQTRRPDGDDIAPKPRTRIGDGDAPPPPAPPPVRSMGAPPPPKPPLSNTIPDDTAQKVGNLQLTLKDDMLQFSKLFLEIGRELRKFAREDRDANAVSQMTALGNAAQEVREAGLMRMIGAMVNAASNIASGAANMRGAAQQANVLKGANKPQGDRDIEMTEMGRPRTPPGKDQQQIANELAPINTRTQGQSQLATGVGGMIAAAFEYSASLHDAAKLEYDRQATLADQARLRANDQNQAMETMIRDIMEKLGQVQRGQSETEGKIVVA